MLGRRKSITDPTPGVTRDPVRSLWSLFGTPVVLVDTGGLTESKEFLDRHITRKSLEAAEEAMVLVFVVDVDGLTADDDDFMRRLRKFTERIIMVVNKVDNEKRAAMVHEYESLGFSPVVPLSAAHGSGVPELLDAIADRIGIVDREGRTGALDVRPPVQWTHRPKDADKHGAIAETASDEDELDDATPDEEGFPDTGPVKAHWGVSVAILGQPNTGKSTLLNFLTNSDMSLVSPVAGTTRDVIEGSFVFQETTFRILDTAGIRRKARVHEDLEYFSVNRALAAIEEADVVFLMIDAEKGLSDQDKKIAAQIVKSGRGVILVVNKWDLLAPEDSDFEKVKDRIRFQFPVLSFSPVVAISAKTGYGMEHLLKTALQVRDQLCTRMETGQLNQMLERWIEFTPPPTTSGSGRWKLRYITQVSAHPLHFVLFVNKAEGFPEAYISFLTNQIRRECKLDLVPLKLTLRASGGKKNAKKK